DEIIDAKRTDDKCIDLAAGPSYDFRRTCPFSNQAMLNDLPMNMQRPLVLIIVAGGTLLAHLALAQQLAQTRKPPLMTDDDVAVGKIEPAATPKASTGTAETPSKLPPGWVAPAGNFANVWADAFTKLKSLRSFRVRKQVDASRSRIQEQSDSILYPPEGFVG